MKTVEEVAESYGWKVTYVDGQGRTITKEESQQRIAEIEEAIRLANTPIDVKETPPLAARFALHFFLSKKQRDPLIGDLEEEYNEELTLFGKKAADVLYWKQSLLSLFPLLWQALVRTVRLYDLLRTIK